MRRRSTGRVDEVAFADVAMAILGPIVLIMTISLMIAAKTSAQSECTVVAEPLLDEKAQAAREWSERIRGEIEERRHLLAMRCGRTSVPLDRTPGDDVVPLPLAGLCRPSRDAVLARAGVDMDGLRRLAADRDLVNAEMALCAGTAPEPTCRTLRSADVAAYVDELRQFRSAIVLEARQLREIAWTRCGLSVADRVDPAPVLVLPQSLTDVCPVELGKLMASAGVSRQDLLLQVALRDAALRGMKACVAMLPQGRCDPLADGGTDTVARALKAWHADAEREVRAYDAWIGRNCPQPIPEVDTEPSFRPAPLAGLCHPDAEQVMAKTGVGLAALLAVEGRRRARAALLSTCVARQPETFGDRDKQFEFKKCSTMPKVPDLVPEREMPKADVEARFDELARETADKLAKRFYNRVDILGHTDDVAVGEKGCAENGARDNVQLSLLRADWFRQGLIAAFKRAPEKYGDILARQNARELRIYPIGVGEQEPLSREPGEDEGAFRRRNRRIEVRLVHNEPPGDGR
ncbi:MAG TPA: hypothetical protein VD995_30985 [Azospirillum sp.]|nr:hypothetical protein [Azospirillum sp.]